MSEALDKVLEGLLPDEWAPRQIVPSGGPELLAVLVGDEFLNPEERVRTGVARPYRRSASAPA